jgi:uncharacterized protein YciI
MMKRLLMLLCLSACLLAAAQAAEAPALLHTFIVEYRTGASWDTAKPPHEQKHFADHSTHLKRMRDDGRILLGARYADKGVLVMQASSADELRKLIASDAAVANGLFTFELHPFNVFYGGCVPARNKPC